MDDYESLRGFFFREGNGTPIVFIQGYFDRYEIINKMMPGTRIVQNLMSIWHTFLPTLYNIAELQIGCRVR